MEKKNKNKSTYSNYSNSIFNIFNITKEDEENIKIAINLISTSIPTPTKISETVSLEEIFNLLPEINKKEDMRTVFCIFFAENCREKGNILFEKLFLEEAFKSMSKNFGDYSVVLLPITFSLSNAYMELGLIDDCYSYLNKSFKIAYFNNDLNSLEVLEVLNKFVLFSKHISEINEERIYSEIIGNIIEKNLIKFNKKNKASVVKLNEENKINNENKAKNKNPLFIDFKYLPYQNKLESLIQLSYFLKHIDYLTTYGKIGKNTEYILKKFNYCNDILENMEILNEGKILNFDSIFKDSDQWENNIVNFSDKRRIEENFIFFYLTPDLKNFQMEINLKNCSEDVNNKNENTTRNSPDQINSPIGSCYIRL